MILLKNISKTFVAGSNRIEALKNVSVEVSRGQIFGVIGASGAGKSTLIRCVNLLEKPDSGEVWIGGRNLLTLPPGSLMLMRRKIGMIFQHFNLLSSCTVYDNIAFPLKLEGKTKNEILQRVNNLLEMVGLEDKRDAYPANLSGGQKQRVAIARALANEPDILLSDEATSALDPATTRSILSLLQDINTKLGITILLITHEMEVIKTICSEVAIMADGRLVEQGKVEDIFASPKEQITQKLIEASIRVAIPPSYLARLKASGDPLLQICIAGKDEQSGIISFIQQNYGVHTHIISAQVDYVGEINFGIILAKLSGETSKVGECISFLVNHNKQTKIVGYV